MAKRQTPQEKKILSYQKDRSNSYGQNQKAARRAIPAAKARGNRRYRSQVRQALRMGDIERGEVQAESVQLDKFAKSPDRPLARKIGSKWWHRGSVSKAPSELQAEALRRLAKTDPQETRPGTD